MTPKHARKPQPRRRASAEVQRARTPRPRLAGSQADALPALTRKYPRNPTFEHWRAPFLEALELTGNVRASCKYARIARQTAYTHRNSDEAFCAEWNERLEEAIELLEGEARARAMVTSDTLMIFLLKSHRPDVYRERRDVSFSGKVPITFELDMQSAAEDGDDPDAA
jgi:hypothetical protein